MIFMIEFWITDLPKMTNPSGARSTHWRVKKAEADKWKKLVKFYVPYRPLQPLNRAHLTLTRVSSVCPDSDGLVSGFKHVIDGLVIAGVLANDKFKNIGMPDYRWEKGKPKEGFIKIRVEEIAEPETETKGTT